MRKEALKTKLRTLDEAVVPISAGRVELALKQGYGPPCVPVVKPGKRVRAGELVAASIVDSMSLRLHSPIAGVVFAVAPRPTPSGTMEDAVVIDADSAQGWVTMPRRGGETPEAIRDIVKEAGIIGMGGAGFPTYLKLSLLPDDEVDTAIINGCECEHYLTGDYRVLTEQADEVADGLNLIRKATGANRGYVVTDTDRKKATRNIEPLIGNHGNQVMHIDHEGVLGYEKLLIRSSIGREVPFGKLPKDVGVVVQNVQTAAAISQAVRHGKPLTTRVVTVSGGAVGRPGNYRVFIGTSVETILNACECDLGRAAVVIMGGPMMGTAVMDMQTSIRKGTGGILALTEEEVRQLGESPCIRCGSCASACPVGLVPASIARMQNASPASLVSLWAEYCVECGECEYVCPSRQPLLEKMQAAKAVLKASREKNR